MVVAVSSFRPDKLKNSNDKLISTDYRNGPTIYKQSYDLNVMLNLINEKYDMYFLIAPDNGCTNQFMNRFDTELRRRLINNSSKINYSKYKSKVELDFYYSGLKDSNTSMVVGILFNNECRNKKYNDFLKHFSFTLKSPAPATTNFASLFPDKQSAAPSEDNFYTRGIADGSFLGFVETQNLVNLVYLNLVKEIQETTKKFEIVNVVGFKYPYPAYTARPPSSLIDFIPSVLVFGFIILFPIIVKRQATESYTRVREMFKLMGLNDWAYFGTSFLVYLIEIILQSFLLTFLYTFKFNSTTAVFNHTNPLLVFLILLLYGVNLILFGFLIAIPFKRPIIAVIMSLIIYVITDDLRYFIDPKFNKAINSNAINSIQLLACLFPNASINFIMRLLSIHELFNVGGNFSNLFETTYQYGELSVGLILIMNVISIFLYSILIWYLDAVWPFQHGIIKPWYFPLNPILKLFKIENPNELTTDQANSNDSKYFEEEKTKNRIKISIQNLTKKFGKKQVVSNINLNLHENHLIALLGENGAGKTTLMNILTGLFSPTKGKVFIDNFNVQEDGKQARKSISLCPQHNIL